MDVQKTPAGWYRHPSMVDTLRYWDGEHWTEHTAPAPQAPIQAASVSTWKIASGVAVGLLSVIALLVFLGQCAAEQSRSDCLIENVNRAADGRPLIDCPD